MKVSTEKATDRYGLVANGSSGAWDVSINETIRRKVKWYADIVIVHGRRLPSCSLIDSPSA
jgi:hypothetical protein